LKQIEAMETPEDTPPQVEEEQTAEWYTTKWLNESWAIFIETILFVEHFMVFNKIY
jgi:hypothetical protein